MKKPIAPDSDSLWSLRAASYQYSAEGERVLTDRQRQDLIRIGMRVRLPARMMVYREDSPALWVFAIIDGAVKCYRDLPSGKRVVGAFLFARDLFGLAENGRYLNCAQTLTVTTMYRLPIGDLAALLKHDADMQFKFLMKVTHELREAQRRAILISRRDAAGRLAMFISQMEKRECPSGHPRVVALPMTRSDIAGFLSLSLESVSRAAAELEQRGLVQFENLHRARIVDAEGFARLVATV
ncbi:MAG TPA: helix-turn-helix domain-containing protein [Vicinamibacterales bacterium]|nr:helix-turn-helix domain-containing protein [Vicinamibacterales bacterium]